MAHDFPQHRGKTFAAVLACWIGFGLVAWWAMSGRSGWFDRAGLLFWRQGQTLAPAGPAWLVPLVIAVTTAGESLFRYLISTLGAALLALRGRRRDAVWLAVTVLSAAAVDSLLKLMFARERPDLVPWIVGWNGKSFPSGHAFNAAAVYLALALVMAAPRRRTAAIAAAVALSLGVAFSRVWLGVHWPTDAIAGWLGGIGWALLASRLR